MIDAPKVFAAGGFGKVNKVPGNDFPPEDPNEAGLRCVAGLTTGWSVVVTSLTAPRLVFRHACDRSLRLCRTALVFACVSLCEHCCDSSDSGKKGPRKARNFYSRRGLLRGGGGVIEEIKETGKNIFPSMFSRAAGRVVRLSSGVAVLQGTCHPPLAAHTRLTPRHWKEADDQVGLGGFRV